MQPIYGIRSTAAYYRLWVLDMASIREAKLYRYMEPPTNPSDLAWLAGILEGEGCFGHWPDNKGVRYPTISLLMTDRDIVERTAEYLGSRFYSAKPRHPSTKTLYRLVVNGAKAAKFMLALLPYVGERRSAKINGILRCWIGQQL